MFNNHERATPSGHILQVRVQPFVCNICVYAECTHMVVLCLSRHSVVCHIAVAVFEFLSCYCFTSTN